MGIDFSHGNAHWAYSGFNRFRAQLAEQIGMKLKDMEGFDGTTAWKDFEDDIIPLLNHSDCDGHLTISECKKIAPRLKELIKDWDDINSDKSRAEELIIGMEDAIDKNENLEFH
jgi:hypothetical protein